MEQQLSIFDFDFTPKVDEAFRLGRLFCKNHHCGYCLYHGEKDFTVCEAVKRLFHDYCGDDWCKENIQYFESSCHIGQSKEEYESFTKLIQTKEKIT